MTRNKQEIFWVLIRVVKFSGVPHFLTPDGKSSLEVLEAKRYASQREAEEAIASIQKNAGFWAVVRKITLTVSFSLQDPYDSRTT